MKILNTLILFVGIAFTLYLVGCGSEGVTPIDETQIDEDSIAQSNEDNDSIDWYIQNRNIHDDSIHLDTASGVRYAILERGTGAVPNLNEILSVDYNAFFLNDIVFNTTSRSIALLADSMAYVIAYSNNDTTFNDILLDTKSTLTYEEKVDSLNNSDGKVRVPLFFSDDSYLPIVFNYTTNGAGIPSPTLGFRIGLINLFNHRNKQDEPIFELGAKGIIFVPSAVGHGISGSNIDPDGEDIVPPNTVLVYEFHFVNIRG